MVSAAIETEHWIGATMRFVFPDDAPLDNVGKGEILEFDPPKVFAFRWNEDVLRFELIPENMGCCLVFTQTVGGGWIGRLTVGRNASGWDACLDTLRARLADEDFERPTDWLRPMERYIDEFGLNQGEARETPYGYQVLFARDLVWQPIETVWNLLTEGQSVDVGGKPPIRTTNDYVAAGPVTAVDAPRVLEYEWRHESRPAGRVRWEIVHAPNSAPGSNSPRPSQVRWPIYGPPCSLPGRPTSSSSSPRHSARSAVRGRPTALRSWPGPTPTGSADPPPSLP